MDRILVDDDQDAVIIHVTLEGPGSCHVGYESCFYPEIDLSVAPGTPARLTMIEQARRFDVDAVYAGLPNPTKL